MPTLDWIGKKAFIRHHAEVPFHLLKEEPALSCGGEAGAGNRLMLLKQILAEEGVIFVDAVTAEAES